MYEIETSEGDDGTMHPPNSFDLPPIVISDLFGIHPNTAYAWAQYAQNSWAEYLEAVQSTD
ncbi:hypothetical protein ACFW9F_01915 [Streptomyces sp. NPDC059506]|uniref:hypothetical protein n=1 Tax=Streptomyces sp. NPDC059506 TaxID=3347751 RepID=UPI003695F9CD